MKIYTYNVFGSELQVYVSAKWAKVYLNGTLCDWTVDADNTKLQIATPNAGKLAIYVNLAYDVTKQTCKVVAQKVAEPLIPVCVE